MVLLQWPTPSSYSQRPLLGPRQRTTLEAPSFSIGVRRKFDLAKPGKIHVPVICIIRSAF